LRGKDLKNVIFSVIAVSLLAIYVQCCPVVAQGTMVYIEPPWNYYRVGETFIIDVKIANVQHLNYWVVKVSFNASVLNCLNATFPPDHIFDQLPYIPLPPIIDNENGYVRHGAALFGPITEVFGSGGLSRIAFVCVASGYSVLKIDIETQLKDPNGYPIPFISSDGHFHTPILGDITGPEGKPDGKVDMWDIAAVAKLFGQPIEPSDPRDIFPDGKIDMKDIGIVARNFGQHLP
jgi:hypothetical protein